MMSDDDTMSISDPVDMHRNCLDLGNRPTLRKSSIIIPHFNSWHMYHTHTGLPSFPHHRMIMIAAHMPWSIACLTWPSTVPWTHGRKSSRPEDGGRLYGITSSYLRKQAAVTMAVGGGITVDHGGSLGSWCR